MKNVSSCFCFYMAIHSKLTPIGMAGVGVACLFSAFQCYHHNLVACPEAERYEAAHAV